MANKWRPVNQGPVVEQAQSQEQPQPQPQPQTQPGQSQPPVEAQSQTRAGTQPPTDPQAAAQEQAPIPPTAPTAPTVPPVADLAALISTLSPEQLDRVRTLASSRGIAKSISPRVGPTGGRMVTIEIPAEACEPLSEWAREAGESFEEFVGKVAGDAITNYCFGDWSAVTEKPAPVIVAAAPEPVAAK